MRVKKLLSFLLVMIMTISLIPASVFADIGNGYGQCPHHAEHNAECGFENGGTCNFVCEICIGTVNNLVAQLPDIKEMKQMTENEKSELAVLIDQIDKEKLNLSDAGREQIDWSAYDVACIVLYMTKGYFGQR